MPPPRDPLVLDTDRSGYIETISIDDSNAYFDITDNGMLEKTGWINPGDALLAYDANGNGRIDGINEVFGNMIKDGFAELREIADSNGDAQRTLWQQQPEKIGGKAVQENIATFCSINNYQQYDYITATFCNK